MGVHIDDNKFIITDTKTFYFDFDLPKDVDKDLKREIGHITKQNGYIAKQRIKNETNQLLFKYKHGNNTHEHRNQ